MGFLNFFHCSSQPTSFYRYFTFDKPLALLAIFALSLGELYTTAAAPLAMGGFWVREVIGRVERLFVGLTRGEWNEGRGLGGENGIGGGIGGE